MSCLERRRRRSSARFGAWLLLVLLGTGREGAGQTITLDTFNAGSATGAITGGTSWAGVGAVTQTAGSIAIAASNDNGWGVTRINVDGSAMTYVRVTAQRESGNVAPSFVIQFEDPGINTVSVAVNTTAFAVGAMSHVLIPITWGGEFDATRLGGWNLGGGAPPPGQANVPFLMTLDHLALTSGLSLTDGGTFTTVGNQTYSGAQTLSAATVVNTFGTAGNAVTFSSTIDGASALTINTPGTTTFSGAVGHTTPLASVTTDAGGTTVINGGKVVTTGAQIYHDTVSLGGDTLIKNTTGAAIQFSQALQGNNHSLVIDSPGGVAFNSAGGLTALTKTGGGTMTMTGTSTYTGATAVNGGTLNLSGSATSSAFTISSGAQLMGTGSLGALTVTSGGTLSPGASTGTLSAGNTTLQGGAVFNWEVNHVAGTPGGTSGWDLLAISGSLTLDATSGNPLTIRLNSLNGSVAGLAAGFSSSANYSFTFVTTTLGVGNFAANAFTFDSTGFQNPFTGTWSVGLNGNDLVLNYAGSAIPEPSTYALWAGVAGLLFAGVRRQRSRRPSARET